MLIEFDKDYLRELFEQGRTSDKKHRYQPEIIKDYKKCVMYLKRANNVEQLYPYTLPELRGSAGRQKWHFVRAHKPSVPT